MIILETSQQALLLPQGIIREENLKLIDNIFDDCEVLIAAEIIIAVGDNQNIASRADILENIEQGFVCVVRSSLPG